MEVVWCEGWHLKLIVSQLVPNIKPTVDKLTISVIKPVIQNHLHCVNVECGQKPTTLQGMVVTHGK